MSRRSTQLTGIAVLALVAAACEQTPVNLPEATSVVATPQQIELIAGDMTTASAQVLDQRGNVLRGAEVAWSTDAPGVARISPEGIVTAVTPGSAILTARYGSLAAQVAVTVSRDDRDLITSLEITEDMITADRRAGPQHVSFRAFDGYGRHRCDAIFQFHSSDRSVATAASAPGCQIRINLIGPGETTITASTIGVSVSFKVHVTMGGHIAFFTEFPAPEDIFAGNSVTYRVRVIDADNQPLAGHPVNFEASPGRTAATSVTDDEGYAAALWSLPFTLRYSSPTANYEEGGVIFRTQLPGGVVASATDHRYIRPAPAASINFFTLFQKEGRWRMSAASGSVQVPLFTSVYVLVESRDEYGNRRDPWDIAATVDSGPAFPHIHWFDERYYRGIEMLRWEPTTVTVSASDGAASADLQVSFTAGS